MVKRHLETVANLSALIEGGLNTREPDPVTDGITHGQAEYLDAQYEKDLLLYGEEVANFFERVGVFLAQSLNAGWSHGKIHDEAVFTVQQHLCMTQA